MSITPRYSSEGILTNVRSDNHNARFSVRRNERVFYITVSPTIFINSPNMTEKYMAYLEVLKPGEEVIGDIYRRLRMECDPKDIQITSEKHIFPEFFVFELDVIDEKLFPRRVATEESPVRPSFIRFGDDFLDDLETWTAFYEPARITLSFENPEDALFKPPSKVLIDNCKAECFKPCHSGVQTKRELETYKMIQASGLDSKFNLCRVYGVVFDEYGFVLGVLLTYVDDRGCPLSTKIAPGEPDNPPPEVRQRWDQIEAAVSGLLDAGIVWGDVKAENVLVDQDNNAWVTDFGGGYTKGWID